MCQVSGIGFSKVEFDFELLFKLFFFFFEFDIFSVTGLLFQ